MRLLARKVPERLESPLVGSCRALVPDPVGLFGGSSAGGNKKEVAYVTKFKDGRNALVCA